MTPEIKRHAQGGVSSDVVSGLAIAALGAFLSVHAWIDLPLGRGLRMGPGYFPFCIGLVLAVLGTAIAVTGRAQTATPLRGSVRAVVFIGGAILAFCLLVRGAGIFPATVAAVALARFAMPGCGLRATLALALGLASFCSVTLVWALGLPIPIFGPLLRGVF